MNENISLPPPYWLLNGADDKQVGFVIVLTSMMIVDDVARQVEQLFENNSIVIDSSNILSDKTGAEYFISTTTQLAWKIFEKLLQALLNKKVDVFVLPRIGRKKKLLVCDMDCTIVKTETLDDIANSVGLGAEVSEITTRAMQGKLDFRKALHERIQLLKGISLDKFDEIAASVQFNHGAELLIESAKEHEIRTVLISGGFEPIVKVVAEKLGFDHYVCSKLDVSDSKLTGKVLNPIVDAEMKLKILLEENAKLDLSLGEVCAIGDGANDLPMLQAAGLGIAYQGKPIVRAGTPHQINFSSLDSALLIMGIA